MKEETDEGAAGEEELRQDFHLHFVGPVAMVVEGKGLEGQRLAVFLDRLFRRLREELAALYICICILWHRNRV